jgi:hypothetical protein
MGLFDNTFYPRAGDFGRRSTDDGWVVDVLETRWSSGGSGRPELFENIQCPRFEAHADEPGNIPFERDRRC